MTFTFTLGFFRQYDHVIRQKPGWTAIFKSERHVVDRVDSLRALLPPLTGFTNTDTNEAYPMKAEKAIDSFTEVMDGILNARTIEEGQVQSQKWNPKALSESRRKSVSDVLVASSVIQAIGLQEKAPLGVIGTQSRT